MYNNDMEPTPEEIQRVQERLAQTPNDPNLVILECHCFSLDDEEPNCRECSVYQEHVKKYPDNHIPR